jgi:small GTP-binding protein
MAAQPNESDVKVVIFGDSGVGAGSIYYRLCDHTFPPDGVVHTGAMFESYSTEVESCLVVAQIWLLAGQRRYQNLAKMYMRHAVGAVAVYDLAEVETFTQLTSSWIPLFLEAADPPAKVVILGNKADLVDPGGEVELMAREFARGRGYSHFTVSAKTGEGIEACFEDLLGSIVRWRSAPLPGPVVEVAEDTGCTGGHHRRETSRERVHR